MVQDKFTTFQDFYPFYLSQHSNPVNRTLHVVGTSLALLFLLLSIFVSGGYFFYIFLAGYGLAWIGHFVFEKNRPATFKYPLMSLMGDFRMLYEVATGQLRMYW